MKYQKFSSKTFSILLAVALCLSWLPASTISAQAVASNSDLLLLTNPSGTGNAAPAAVFAGANSLLTVTVTPGADPASTGITVAADLTLIGGSATQSFFDNATNGDVTSATMSSRSRQPCYPGPARD